MCLSREEVGGEEDGRIQVEAFPAEIEIRLVRKGLGVGLRSQLRMQSLRQLKGREGSFPKPKSKSGLKD